MWGRGFVVEPQKNFYSITMSFKLVLSIFFFLLVHFQIFGQSISIDSLLNEAAKYRQKPDQLIEINSEIIRLDPYNFNALHERGVGYYRQWITSKKEDKKAFENALQDFSRAIIVNEKYHPAYYSRSLLYQEAKELELSLQDITKAILLDINNPDYFQRRGKIYLDIKNYNLADANFDIAIKLIGRKYYNGNKRDVLVDLYKDKAFSLAKAGNYKKALKAINKAIDFGISWESILYKGNIYAEMGEYKKALKMYNYITKRTNSYLPVYLHRGRVLYALNEKEKAIADWVIMIERGLDIDLKKTSIKPGF